MDVYTTESEQIEQLKKWWKENGKSVIAGVVIGVSVLFAAWAWRDHTRTQAEAASAEYQLLIGDVEKGDARAGLERAARIRNQYGDTPYAVFAALAMAKFELEQGNAQAAVTHLQWALSNAEEDSLRHIARLRLARVMIDSDQAAAALKLVSDVQPGGFLSAYEEVKGDAYMKTNQPDAAHAAYTRALAALGEESDPEQRELLQMKLDDLGTPNVKENK
ncbi:MAG: tetratricopeptide repeat protein [Pseudomonadota bacterium]